jgi:surfeit locus 1 family protein
MKLRGPELALAIGAVVVAGVCVRLSVWQLDRLAARRARNAEFRAARDRPPLEITRDLGGDSLVNRRVVARGVYDYEHERLWRARTYQGMPGVHLITPLRLADGAGVLVDRGWVPSPDAARIDRDEWRGPDTVVIEGLAVALPRGRGDSDPRTLADSVPYPLLAVGVQLLPSPSVPATGRESFRVRPRPPLPAPAPPLGNGPHLAYAIQWLSFALIVLVGTFALLRKPAGTA